jgi:single-stranded DNA-binding protein
VCWRSLATNVALSVRKGDSVMVTGRLRESAWTDKEGNAHQRMEIDADVVAVDLRRGGAIKLPKLNRDALPASEFDAAVPTEPTDLADPLDELDPEQASSVAVDAINELRQRASSERSAELVGAGSEPPF